MLRTLDVEVGKARLLLIEHPASCYCSRRPQPSRIFPLGTTAGLEYNTSPPGQSC